MKSSMSTGERRWASSGRRGGMTVIGKVVVPKPINLPSQRLENHGLDPNAEITPKGTPSWGSKSSSTASNPWGSSTPSPNTDGGGRPSSGGSGTRPSTASSDITYESVNSAWGQNSRPSSASGVVTSNRTTLTSLRPRSAETRPGSSQLSRFAESVTENSGAWGATGTAEKLGVISKNDGFSLASGDFPTLGAEKETSEKNIESQVTDHGSHDRPGSSSSSGVAPAKQRNTIFTDGESSGSANVKSNNADSWKRDGEDGMKPSVEKWHGDPQPYPNANIRPHHYEAWRGPPVNNPPPTGGVWYRGPPGAPPYGNPVPPGGFPMEQFPYFHPQMPLANPQPVPPPGAGPRGHHPRNGDMYRPHMPDAYVRPGIPMRPGFYPGPVPYDGYFGPPMGYCNPNERDMPFMGMGAGPAVYNRHSSQNGPDPGNHHARSNHPHDTRGPYKVLLKQHNGLDGKNDHKREGNATSSATCNEKGDQPRTLEENERGEGHKNEGMSARKTAIGEEASYQTTDSRGSRSSVRTKINSHEEVVNNRVAVDDISVKKLEPAAYSFPESQQPLLSAPEESSLIQKIEGLNAKARDARHDVSSVYTRDDHMNKIQVGKANHAANEAGTGSVYHERSHSQRISTPPSEGIVSTGDRNLESTNGSGVTNSRRSHGMQGRSDHRGRGRINGQEGDEWQKRSPVVHYQNRVSAVQAGTSIGSVQDRQTPMLASENSGAYPQMKDERQIGVPMFDPNDPQRAKMIEVAQQRLKQRQKEEEERISRQKANALAKLEELNRRSQTVECSGDNIGSIKNSKGLPLAESVTVSECNTNRSEKPVLVTPECAPTQVVQNLSLHSQSDAHCADACKNTSEVPDGGISKQKHAGFRQKQSMFPEKSAAEKVSSTNVPETLKDNDNVHVDPSRSAEVATNGSPPSFEQSLPESLMHQKRKNKSAKNKHKAEAVSSTASLPSSARKETNSANISVDNVKPKLSEPESLLQSVMASKDAHKPLNQHLSLSNEESHVRVNNLSKSQNSRRVQRNPQTNRVAEKFSTGDAVVWAPIRSHNIAEVADEASGKPVVEAISSTVKDSVQNSYAKNRRVEIELYVPKPVAKELAQQVTVQQQVAPTSSKATTSDGTVESADSGSQGTVGKHPANSDTGKVGLTMEHRNVDGRQNKQGKAHGSWRQRGASESNRNFGGSVEHQQPKMAEESSEKEQPKLSSEGSAHHVSNIPKNSDSVPVVKDQGVTGRGKRQPFRGQRSMGNSHDIDHKKINSRDTVICAQSFTPETNSTARQDGSAAGERSVTHWQPKSQSFSGSNDRGVQPEVSRGKKKESSSGSGMPPPSQNMETSDVIAQSHHDHHVSVGETPSVGNQQVKRERKMASHKQNQGLVGPTEPPSASTDIRHEHQSFSGFPMNSNQNNRFGRGHDSRGDWQDDREHNRPASRDRQRQNSQYEYQPVGAYNNNNSKSGNVEGGSQSHDMGGRFRERGRGNLRRGGGRNFYGRQTDSDPRQE